MQNENDRRPGLRALGSLIPGPTKKIFRGRGFAQADIALRWPQIVGDDLARVSLPERITYPEGRTAGATLRIRVVSAFATHLQHLEPLVIERVNTFYGFKAVNRIALVQRPMPQKGKPAPPPPRPLTPAAEKFLADSLVKVKDGSLKAELEALGRLVLWRGDD